MGNIIFSLVSDQTTPNVLFIKEKPEADKYYFVSTIGMEKQHKTEQIIQAAKIEKPTQTIIVSHYDLEKIESELKKISLTENDHVLLNITCGTKIMMLAAFQYFSKRNAEIYYLALGNNSMDKIFPYPMRMEKIKYRLDLREYLSAHGIEYKSTIELYKTEKETTNFFNNHFQVNRNNISLLREIRNDKQIKRFLDKKCPVSIDKITTESFSKKIKQDVKNKIISEKEKISLFLNTTGFNASNISKKDLDYLTGGWFEEFVFSLISNLMQPISDNIALNVEIEKNNVKNELDVVFIKENSLHVIECKTGLKTPFGNIIADTIYKQSALRSNFGLGVHSYIFTLDEIPDVHMNRANEMRLGVIDKNKINNYDEIEKSLLK